MKSTLLATGLSVLAFLSTASSATTWYVDGSVSESGNGLHPWTAFKTIQEGVDAGSDGDMVTVPEGTYVENILFRGRNIVLVGKGAVIDGNQSGSGVRFTGTDDETCVLSGFTIRNGAAEYGGGICGGDSKPGETQTHATIQNNVITHNLAGSFGGGVALCDGAIRNNVISGNSASCGGGVALCDGTIRNNVISGNSASDSGGGLWDCKGIIQSNTIVANSAPNGGGLYPSYGKGTLLNCIIWGNTGNFGEQLHPASEPSYSCIEDWTGGGERNFSGNPRLVDPDGPDDDAETYEDNDYHLLVSSPCIDAGLNEDWMSAAVDLDGRKRIIYGRSSLTVDMGAYEFDSFPLAIVGLAREGPDQGRLTWFSRAGHTYAVWSCVDLCGAEWVELETVPSQVGMTSWTDSAPLGRVKFYRVEMK